MCFMATNKAEVVTQGPLWHAHTQCSCHGAVLFILLQAAVLNICTVLKFMLMLRPCMTYASLVITLGYKAAAVLDDHAENHLDNAANCV